MNAPANTSYLLRAATDLARDLGVVAPIRVLIVDDDAEFCYMLRRVMVEMSGVDYEVDIERDPYQALAKMREQRYDIYIIDENLGNGVSGLELVRELQRGGWHSPFIMVSGSPLHDRAAMSQDCMAYVLKSALCQPAEIDRVVRFSLKNFWTRECAHQCQHEKPLTPGVSPAQAPRLVAA